MRGAYYLALIAMLTGSSAAAIAVAWSLVARDSGLVMPMPVDVADIETLMALRALAVVFQIGTPALATAGLLFGVAGWREPMGKAGLLCAVFALTIYGAALSATVQALAA